MSQTHLLIADTPEALEPVLAAAAAAAQPFAALAPAARAAGLCLIAERLEQNADRLIPLAQQETGLAEARLTGELKRTAVQLRLFAEVVLDGGYLDARLDQADPRYALGVRPDLRRSLRPVGPVVNFSASNFPFAFSVAGGDSAAILAAGCPLIVKGHSGHGELSLATADVVATAARDAGFPTGAFAHITGQETGVAALRDPRVQAGSFTGSIAAGRLLADIAASRPQPIPFFGELGSVNPVVVTPAALAERGEEIVEGCVASVGGSAGQLCTKPGFVFIPAGHGLDEPIAAAATQIAPHRLLNPRIARGYEERLQRVLSASDVRTIVRGDSEPSVDGNALVTPTIAAIALADFTSADPQLHEEVFGPFSLVVEYGDLSEVPVTIEAAFQGNLTGTLHLGEAEYAGTAPGEQLERLRELTALLARTVGRVLFNGWPTGVAVTPAQQHGGPWPATTNDSSTSVGTAAIGRFLRPVAYQNAPEHLLPAELQTANPRGVRRSIDPAGSSLTWGRGHAS
ncbi:aldehyde dehydrogenase (NADP(+)) [Leucobacter sp. wl10]|uniref:aldehyde dehydrogenase (NADP(+)) n=1 Tax=Leucobacter sp. wl10 TaxID=2304677 RepID=UPI000E5B50FB|nr:aldehyde dehydrogenase (NADP(+)) [Leucobacter sp. wl10]RGE20492.1 aldehyde dehydrogenase (NADP(+)) [Leucobacter sp. wl10]